MKWLVSPSYKKQPPTWAAAVDIMLMSVYTLGACTAFLGLVYLVEYLMR